MTIYIKNMVCPRCIKTVEDIFRKLGIGIDKIELGVVQTKSENIDFQNLIIELENAGFELIEDKKKQLIDKIKTAIIDLIHYSDYEEIRINYSDFLSKKLEKDYNYISNLFSEIENITIEKFIILQKIEKVKELIVYNEFNFSEIAYKMNYSSVSHLSKQFKQITGFTPSQFRDQKSRKRNFLDNIGKQ